MVGTLSFKRCVVLHVALQAEGEISQKAQNRHHSTRWRTLDRDCIFTGGLAIAVSGIDILLTEKILHLVEKAA